IFSRLMDRVSVLDFGADPTGATDSTAAYNAAIATGRKVWVPAGLYRVTNVDVTDGNVDVEGECWGLTQRTVLEVWQPASSAFKNNIAGAEVSQHFRFAALTCRAAAGITDARFYWQPNKVAYTAHAHFNGIDTSRSLHTSFEGNFIVSVWENGQDGGDGGPNGYADKVTVGAGRTHYFMDSGGTFGQAQRTNMNWVKNYHILYNSSDAPAVFDLRYGSQWGWTHVRWELNDCPSIRAFGITQGVLERCWLERNYTGTLIILRRLGTGFGQIGCPLWAMRDSNLALEGLTGYIFDCDDQSNFSGENNFAVDAVAGVKLANRVGAMVGSWRQFFAIDGAGVPGFLANTPSPTLSENHLHFGPRNLVAADFTKPGGRDLGIATVSSVLGGKAPGGTGAGTAVRFTSTNFGEAAWIELPMLMVQFLR
ncbi:MAG: hypothetical protein EOO79_10565, partial [Oxalobacteraceae bacterium]